MFANALAAEAAFYDAFSVGDCDAMMAVWARGVDIACIHPSGPRLETHADIARSWELILGEQMLRHFDLRARMIFADGQYATHCLEENISVPGTAFVAPPVLATNVYQRFPDGWYMVLHHGSVAPGAVLERERSSWPERSSGRVH